MARKKPLNIILVLTLTIVGGYFAYHFANYNLKIRYLKKLYENKNIASRINFYLRMRYDATGEMINYQDFKEYLKSYEDTSFYSSDYFLFTENAYHLNIDRSNNKVLLYAFGLSEKDNQLRNIIDLRLYGNDDGDYKQHFSFWNYLKFGDYDLLLVDTTLIYECEEIDNTSRFIDKNGKSKYTSPDIKNINNKFTSLLKEVDLIDGTIYRNNPSKRIVYIYDGIKLKNMCPTELKLDKKKEERLLQLIKNSFPDYGYIKFLVAENKGNG